MKKIKAAAIWFVALAMTSLVAADTTRADDFQLLEINRQAVKWGEPRLGTGAIVTYAFATEIYRFPDARNCGAIKPLELKSRTEAIARDEMAAEFHKAVEAWSAVAAVRFVQAETERDANLLIGAQITPLGRAFANVTPVADRAVERALQMSSANPPGVVLPSNLSGAAESLQSLERSLICLNADLPWKLGFDGDLEVYDLRYTFMHEIGHVLGLNHVSTDNSVMNYRYDESISSLQSGDISGVALLYGRKGARRATDE